jgi:hypothetical protein
MLFKPGDRVRFLDEVGEGIVVEYRSQDAVIVHTEEGFDMTYSASKLVSIVADSDYGMDTYGGMTEASFQDKIRNDQPKKRPQESAADEKKYANTDEIEVDLHIHNLVSTAAGLTNFDMVQIQLQKVYETIQMARERRVKKIVFIHGIGEGKLRTEIRTRLKAMGNLEYFDASYRRYGQGATEVKLF